MIVIHLATLGHLLLTINGLSKKRVYSPGQIKRHFHIGVLGSQKNLVSKINTFEIPPCSKGTKSLLKLVIRDELKRTDLRGNCFQFG